MSSSDSLLDGIVQKHQVAGERAKVLLHRGVCAPHVIHQHHRVRNLVQVDAHRRLDVKADADVAAVAGLGYVQVPTQMGRDEVRPVRYPVRWGVGGERLKSAVRCKHAHSNAN